ncbi:MAG: hypothetical protein J6126_02025 [Clostridia bacterium]|nr:hypothetical protein [Clostridia bacterium]
MEMFKNVGFLIKVVAITFFIFDVIMSIVTGLVFLSDEKPLLRLCVVFGGSGMAYVSSLFLYGFGHLIENTDKLVAEKNKASSEDDETEESD